MTFVKMQEKFWLAVRRPYEISRAKQSLYCQVRRAKKLGRYDMAKLVGISYSAWRYREKMKEQYRIGEIVALKEISGLTWEEFGQLMIDCC